MNKKPVSYFQTDTRWKNEPYRTSAEKSTVGSAGCGPSCAAMLIETLTGKTFTPLDACKWSMNHGYKATGQGTYYSYFAPQFKEFGIDKCVVWRGCGDIPAEFKFCGVNTVNLVRGYFMDYFSAPFDFNLSI